MATPYDLILAILDDQVYRKPSPGFEARMIVMACMNGLLIVLALTYLVLTHHEKKASNRRASNASTRKPPRSFWLFRRVDRSSGKLIIPNHRTLGVFFTVCVALVWIGLCLDSIKVFIKKGDMRNSFGFRAFVFMPMFAHGWVTVWTSLTTFIMTTDRHSTFNLSSRLINLFFIIGGALGLSMAIICSSINLSKAYIFWDKYLELKALLAYDRLNFPNLPPGSYKQASDLANEVQASAIVYFKSGAYTFGPCVILPLAIIVVNIAGLGLCRILQKQIDYNKEQLINSMSTEQHISTSLMHEVGITKPRPAINRLASGATADSSMGIDPLTPIPIHLNQDREKNPSRGDFGFGVKSLTSSDVRRMSAGPTKSHYKDKARTIVVLTRARYELWLFSINAAVISTFIIGTLAYAAIMCNNLKIVTGPWGIFESAIYQGGWYYTSLCLLVFCIVIFQAWIYRDKTTKGSNEDSGTSQTGFDRSAASFTGANARAGFIDPIASVRSNQGNDLRSTSGGIEVEGERSRSCSFAVPTQARGSISSSTEGGDRSRKGSLSTLFQNFNPWGARRRSSGDSSAVSNEEKKGSEVYFHIDRAVAEEREEEEEKTTDANHLSLPRV